MFSEFANASAIWESQGEYLLCYIIFYEIKYGLKYSIAI